MTSKSRNQFDLKLFFLVCSMLLLISSVWAHGGRKDGQGSERTDPGSTYYSNTYNTEFWAGICFFLLLLIFLIIFGLE